MFPPSWSPSWTGSEPAAAPPRLAISRRRCELCACARARAHGRARADGVRARARARTRARACVCACAHVRARALVHVHERVSVCVCVWGGVGGGGGGAQAAVLLMAVPYPPTTTPPPPPFPPKHASACFDSLSRQAAKSLLVPHFSACFAQQVRIPQPAGQTAPCLPQLPALVWRCSSWRCLIPSPPPQSPAFPPNTPNKEGFLYTAARD